MMETRRILLLSLILLPPLLGLFRDTGSVGIAVVGLSVEDVGAMFGCFVGDIVVGLGVLVLTGASVGKPVGAIVVAVVEGLDG